MDELHPICVDCEKHANRICARDEGQLAECLACQDFPPGCTLRLRVAGKHRVFIPARDNRYYFEPGKEYRMSPTALHRMLDHLAHVTSSRDDYYVILGQLLIDKPGEWDIDALYVLRGRGIMKLVNIFQAERDRTTLNFLTPGLLNYWSDPEEVYRRAGAEDIKAHCEGQRVAGFTKSADQIEKWWKELNDAE
jgi:hypothetical protein